MIGKANRGKKRPDLAERNKLNSIPVRCIDTGIVYASSHEAEHFTGAPHSSIIRVCKKEYGRNTAGGLHWEFEEPASCAITEFVQLYINFCNKV